VLVPHATDLIDGPIDAVVAGRLAGIL
jgi:hypothetical protein